uniref:Putative secreted protein n=1 Tax=Panstrongylus lignarius TaxID=156445 RepID=A0A224XI46_9HEMI
MLFIIESVLSLFCAFGFSLSSSSSFVSCSFSSSSSDSEVSSSLVSSSPESSFVDSSLASLALLFDTSSITSSQVSCLLYSIRLPFGFSTVSSSEEDDSSSLDVSSFLFPSPSSPTCPSSLSSSSASSSSELEHCSKLSKVLPSESAQCTCFFIFTLLSSSFSSTSLFGKNSLVELSSSVSLSVTLGGELENVSNPVELVRILNILLLSVLGSQCVHGWLLTGIFCWQTITSVPPIVSLAEYSLTSSSTSVIVAGSSSPPSTT